VTLRGSPFEGLGRPLTVKEAAEWLGLSRWTIYERIRLGEIPHRKRGRVVRLLESELRAWLVDGCELERVELSDGRLVRPKI
jgi:excisionase family DNA binding protein